MLLAFQNPVLQFNTFDPLTSVNFVGFATIGGIGHLIGPLFGSGFQNGGVGSVVLNSIGGLDTWLPLIGGITLILVLLQNPNGIAGAPLPAALRRAVTIIFWLGRPPSTSSPRQWEAPAEWRPVRVEGPTARKDTIPEPSRTGGVDAGTLQRDRFDR